MDRRRFLKIGAGALAAGAVGTVGYTFFVEPHWLEVVERPLPVRRLPPALAGRRLAQLSDLHVGAQVDSDYLVRSLRALAALEPDVVAITGDLVSYEEPGEMTRMRRGAGGRRRAP